jgi:hypothetical protein
MTPGCRDGFAAAPAASFDVRIGRCPEPGGRKVSARTPEEIHAQSAAAFNTGDLEAFLALHEEDGFIRRRLAP